jgi:peptidoglycan/xylan/chitin deacetylase (PgdA/CDA1 family)
VVHGLLLALVGALHIGAGFFAPISGWFSQANGAVTATVLPHSPPTGVCPTDPLAPARTPTVAIDVQPGPTGAARYGGLQYRRTPLAPGEIALTIDDGPDAVRERMVLDILDRHCLKATFFMVGWYAAAHPELVREVAARGHTIGTHTWLHPNNLRRLSPDHARLEIDRGLHAVQSALTSAPPQDRARFTPFFRFPGLNDSRPLLSWLGDRQLGVISADFGADDWKGISAAEIERRALKAAAQTRGGVLILHETKRHTVEGLSDLITAFEQRGYRFVQLTPQQSDDARQGLGQSSEMSAR